MSITINGATNTLTAASGLTIAGNTAVTGTLSATGTITGTDTNIAAIFGQGGTGTVNGRVNIDGSSAASYGSQLIFRRNSVTTTMLGQESGINGGASDDFAIYSGTANLNLYGGGVKSAVVSSTGLAVTGTLSASGTVKFGAGSWPTSTIGQSGSRAAIASSTESGYLVIADMQAGVAANRGGEIWLGARGTDATDNLASARLIGYRTSAVSGTLTSALDIKTSDAAGTLSTAATFSSTGLAVTGTLSATGAVDFGTNGGPGVSVGDASTSVQYHGMFRGSLTGTLAAGTYLNIGGYDGVNVTVGHAVLGSQTKILGVSSTGLAVTGLLDLSAASSGQIKFPATQNASADANTLDDYEEGTFTPTATSITGTNTYSGYYTKIGNRVSGEIVITTSDTIGITAGSSRLTLPFTVSNYSAMVGASNVTTGVSYGGGHINVNGVYPPTAAPGAGQSVVVSFEYGV